MSNRRTHDSAGHRAPLPLEYAQPHPRTKPSVRRSAAVVAITFDPLPKVALRVLGLGGLQPQRWLRVVDGVVHFPGGCVRDDYDFHVRRPWTMPGIVQLVAMPKNLARPRHVSNNAFRRLETLADEIDPPGLIPMIYGTDCEDFDWLVVTLRRVRQMQWKRQENQRRAKRS